MKTKRLFIFFLFASAIFIASAQNIQGTWEMMESSGNPSPEGYTQLKFITPTHFIWMKADPEGNIISGASGTYTYNDGVYTESILYTLPGMKPWKGKKGIYSKVKFEGKNLIIEGYLEIDSEKKFKNTETWVKID